MSQVRIPGGYSGPVLVQRRCYGSVTDIGYVAANMSFLYTPRWFSGGSGCALRFQSYGYSPFDMAFSTVRRRGYSRQRISRIKMAPYEGYDTTAVSITSYTAPKEAQKLLQKGRKSLLGAHRDLAKATEHLEAAVALHPDYAEAWTLLGLARMTRGAMTTAQAAFERSIEIDSQYGAPYTPLAKILVRRSDFRRALEVSQTGVALNPADSDLKYALVLSAFSLEETELARRWAEQLYQGGEAEYYPTVIYVLAKSAAAEGQHLRAARLYEEYLGHRGRPNLRKLSQQGLREALLADPRASASILP